MPPECVIMIVHSLSDSGNASEVGVDLGAGVCAGSAVTVCVQPETNRLERNTSKTKVRIILVSFVLV